MTSPASDSVGSRDAASACSLVLPPFRSLLENQPGIRFHDNPYGGPDGGPDDSPHSAPFEAYYHHASGSQTWDLDEIGAITRQYLADRSGGEVLDIGCGRGRAALHLAAAGHPVTAIDSSPTATARLRTRIAADGCGDLIRVVTGDIRDSELLPRDHFAVAVVADLSINLFANDSDVTELLAAVRRTLRPNGVLCVPVLHPDSLDHFTRLRGLFTSPFVADDGRHWLVWVAMRYDGDTDGGPYFLRTLFAQDDNAPEGTLRGHVTAVRERLWTAERLRPHFAAADLHIAERRGLRIPAHPNAIDAELLVVSRNPPPTTR